MLVDADQLRLPRPLSWQPMDSIAGIAEGLFVAESVSPPSVAGPAIEHLAGGASDFEITGVEIGGDPHGSARSIFDRRASLTSSLHVLLPQADDAADTGTIAGEAVALEPVQDSNQGATSRRGVK